MNNEWVIECQNVGKTYDDGSLKVEVLREVDFQVASGEGIGIIGASGSGKSTLLHILGGLDKPTSGEVIIKGRGLNNLSQLEIGRLRNRHLGFVYQFHHLLPEFSALENVMMPLLVARRNKAEAQTAAAAILEKVGLGQRIAHRTILSCRFSPYAWYIPFYQAQPCRWAGSFSKTMYSAR